MARNEYVRSDDSSSPEEWPFVYEKPPEVEISSDSTWPFPYPETPEPPPWDPNDPTWPFPYPRA